MIIGKIDKNLKYETIEIDLAGIETRKDLLYKVSKELNFPIIDEDNWDAFYDWLCFLYEPFDKYEAVRIVFKNCEKLNGEVKKIFIELLQNSADNGFIDDLDTEIPCYYEILDKGVVMQEENVTTLTKAEQEFITKNIKNGKELLLKEDWCEITKALDHLELMKGYIDNDFDKGINDTGRYIERLIDKIAFAEIIKLEEIG